MSGVSCGVRIQASGSKIEGFGRRVLDGFTIHGLEFSASGLGLMGGHQCVSNDSFNKQH